jgi:hypothetical protein
MLLTFRQYPIRQPRQRALHDALIYPRNLSGAPERSCTKIYVSANPPFGDPGNSSEQSKIEVR